MRPILRIIADLMSEEGENSEYDRACVEIAVDVIGVPMDERHHVEAILRAMKDTK